MTKVKVCSALLMLTFLLSPKIGKSEGDIFWLQFSDKKNSNFSISNPKEFLSEKSLKRRERQGIAIDSSDLPVNECYIDSVRNLGFTVKFSSKWMNGTVAVLPDSISIESINKPSFIKSTELIKPSVTTKSTSLKFEDNTTEYGKSSIHMGMLKISAIHKYTRGEGVTVAIFDVGFNGADKNPAFDSIRENGQIIGTFDFVKPGNNVYNEGPHGSSVLSIIAANQPNTLMGIAPKASYWLLRIEDIYSEYPVEMYYWAIAAEFADSVGCDVINSSIGYTSFDDSKFDLTYEDLTGDKVIPSKAANMAVEKGIVTIISAGNHGDKIWQKISTPADAKNAISVGSVSEFGRISGFSSIGFSDENYSQKPDVVAMGENVPIVYNESSDILYSSGTSFSAPMITGLATCIVSMAPNKTAFEISDLIRSSSNRYPNHDTIYGYGLPNAELIVGNVISSTSEVEFLKNQTVSIYPNPTDDFIVIETTCDNSNVKIINTDGNTVLSERLSSGKNIISTGCLTKGVYFALLNKQGKVVKLIKR